MKKVGGLSLIALAALAAMALPGTVADRTRAASARNLLARLPLAFEPNRGQTDSQVTYLARGAGFRLFLTQTEAVLAMDRRVDSASSRVARPDKLDAARIEETVLRMKLENANAHATIAPGRQLPGRVNYLVGRDPGRWQRGLPTFAEVAYREVYPGVDLVYHASPQQRVEYDFIVAPGADPRAIGLSVSGADRMAVSPEGDLTIAASGARVTELRPVAYQTIAARRVPVEAAYALSGNHIRIRLGAYDHSRTLVIDPTLEYASYLGGSAFDVANGVVEDDSGNIFLAGQTGSTDFPVTAGAFQTTFSGSADAFITKIGAKGAALLYSTYLGGSRTCMANGLAVDHDRATVAGITDSSDFPVTSNAFQPSLAGRRNGFVAQLNDGGDSLRLSSFIGGAANDGVNAIAIDSSGNLYLAGITSSTNFPVTTGAFQTVYGGKGDGFVAKVDAETGALLYGTYFGGSQLDVVNGVAVDNSDNAYVTGATASEDFPVTAGAFQTTLAGAPDAFVAELNPAGAQAVFSTFLGGSAIDSGNGIALFGNKHPSIAITGKTTSTDFPTENPVQAELGGTSDAFATVMPGGGDTLLFSTYLGGVSDDAGYALQFAGTNHIVLTGSTASSDFPVVAPIQDTLSGNIDAFLTEINFATPKIVSSTFFGGNQFVVAYALFVTSDLKDALFAGYTNSTDLTVTANAIQAQNAGDYDAFVAKVKIEQPASESHAVSGPGLASTSVALLLIALWITTVLIRRRHTVSAENDAGQGP